MSETGIRRCVELYYLIGECFVARCLTAGTTTLLWEKVAGLDILQNKFCADERGAEMKLG